jgi:hypothetical protein
MGFGVAMARFKKALIPHLTGQSVAVTRDAIVAPAGVCSIAIIRACLVLGLAADLDKAGVDRLRDADLAVFRATERVAAFGLDLVMGSSEVCAALSAAPPRPRTGKYPAGQTPKRRPSRSKSLQQRSDQA